MTNHSSSTFQNENLEVIVTKKPGCKISLDVSVAPKGTEASYREAVARVRKEVSIPGFRKGKVPEAMVQQKYGKYIEQEWRDVLLNTALSEAILLTSIQPFNKNSVTSASVKSLSKDEGAKLSFTYESAPVIPQIAAETLSIAAASLDTVTQKDIDKTVEELCVQKGEWSDVTDRPIQDGDYVEVDVDNIGENPGNICTNTVMQVKEGRMGTWMRNLLIGKQIGDHVEGMSEKEESEKEEPNGQACDEGTPHEHTHSDFVPTMCRITVQAVKQSVPHNLDDELAKKYGAESVSILLERIKERLEKNALEKQKDQNRFSMEKELLKHYPFDMPASLVEGEVKAAKKRTMDEWRAEGAAEKEISAEWKKVEQEVEHRYDRDFRLYFLTQKYAHDHGLTVSDEEVMTAWMRRMWERGGRPPAGEDSQEALAHLRLQLLSVKAIDHMVEQAQRA